MEILWFKKKQKTNGGLIGCINSSINKPTPLLYCMPFYNHKPILVLHEHPQIMCCRFVQYELLGMLGGINKDYHTSCSLLPFVTVLTIYAIRHNDDHEHYHYRLQAVRNIPIWHTLSLVLFLLSSAVSSLLLRPWEVMSGYGGPCASEEGSLQAHHILC